MNLADRFNALREHGRHRGECDCDSAAIEQHLDHIEAVLAEILTRLPAPDLTPAHITVTAT